MKHYACTLYLVLKGLICLGVSAWGFISGNLDAHDQETLNIVGLLALCFAAPLFCLLEAYGRRMERTQVRAVIKTWR